ncbi:uncharacterized protein M421DRAFT_419262 [Didymella exigua CBS 183.55]|uniref:Adenylyl cyclase-associated protein n=1 Tax=Didymella exigua CBS 183.55 TaxID=1150837 RepID=A0A6A5RP60_9PLEO|nr:uncharacterized protein M421DRAFT_419262 [Didymella exigua CBS 183.55]KAF1930211.1 hypothetical protein M421DRAFT_419262 [Didymella exigua CBS 183.55]
MAQNNMNSLTTLIKRLEAATSRLEDIASSSFTTDSGASKTGTAAAVAAGGAAAAPAAAVPSPRAVESLPPSIAAFDELVSTELKTWLDLSSKMGAVIETQSKAVEGAFAAQRAFLSIANKAKKPDDQTIMGFLKDLQASMEKTDEVRQSNREPALKDPLSMVADGVGSLGWVTIGGGGGPKPHEYITELFGGAQMYGNKVLKEYRDKPEKTNVEWVQAYYKLFKALAEYARKHHPSGVAWNANGIDAKEAARQVSSASGPAAGAIPAPPPPPPPPAGGIPPPPGPPPPPGAAPPAKKAAPDMNAVFDDLNRGSDVTRGLKKVDTSQMTHKNPSLRAQAPVPTRSDSNGSLRGKSPAPPRKPDTMRTKKPPKKELDGNKWIIDNFDSPGDIVEFDAEINHSILISRCKNTTIRVNGKANAISIDNSSRTSIIIDSLVSSVDVIKCPNFALQVVGTLPTVLLDQVDGATIYLGKDSQNTEIFTSKCSSININLPSEDDYSENPLPEQIRSYIANGKIISEIVEHAG